jgi:ATP-dependent RNA helicase DeaD
MFVEPRQRRELEAIEKNANTTIAPWSEGAKVDPAPAEEPARARRHRKPHDVPSAANGGGAYTKLIASGGRAAGLAEADIIHAIAAGAGLDGEAIRNVRMLERFALLEVPAGDAERVAGAVDGTDVRGHTMRLETARS